MALSRRARVRWATIALLIGLPAWIVAAASLAGWIESRWGRLPFVAELTLYVALGLVWILPLQQLFRGIAGRKPTDSAPGQCEPTPRKRDSRGAS